MSSRFARALHDVQRADLNFQPRSKASWWGGLANPPETVTISDESKRIGKGRKIPLSKAVLAAMLRVNGSRAYKAILIPAAGYINSPPNAESLTFGGDLLELDMQDGDWFRVKAIAYDAIPPSHISYISTPQFVHKFNAVRKSGGFLKLGNGLNAYIILLKRTELWIHKSQIELFPLLPFKAIVTARGSMFRSADLHVRLHPYASAPVVTGIFEGDTVVITEYSCTAGDVWGRIEEGWICLQQQSGYKVHFHTTWTMATVPPLQ